MVLKEPHQHLLVHNHVFDNEIHSPMNARLQPRSISINIFCQGVGGGIKQISRAMGHVPDWYKKRSETYHFAMCLLYLQLSSPKHYCLINSHRRVPRILSPFVMLQNVAEPSAFWE